MAGFAGFPTESEIRAKIVEYGRRLYDHGYVVTNDGNIRGFGSLCDKGLA